MLQPPVHDILDRLQTLSQEVRNSPAVSFQESLRAQCARNSM